MSQPRHPAPPWHQLPPAWPVPPPEPPPRRSRPGTTVLAAVVALGLALAGLTAMVGLAAVASTDPRPAVPAGQPHPAPAAGEVPSPARRSPSTAAPTAGSPVLPPGDNPIFRAGLGVGPVECRLPGLATDPAGQTAFYRAAVDCLDRAWLPTLRAAGLPARPALVEVPLGAFGTPCGAREATSAATYCEGTIYLPVRYFTEVEQLPADQPGLWLGVLAHEYGHHVQELAGIMDTVWERRYQAGVNSELGLDISRRNELLATCFAGMFYGSAAGRGSITTAMLDSATGDQGRRGDHPQTGLPRDHGTPTNNAAWFSQGVLLNQAARCNTWLATTASTR